jgi:hypothetical protein
MKAAQGRREGLALATIRRYPDRPQRISILAECAFFVELFVVEDRLSNAISDIAPFPVNDQRAAAAEPRVLLLFWRLAALIVGFRKPPRLRCVIDGFLNLRVKLPRPALDDLGDEVDALLAVGTDPAARPNRKHLEFRLSPYVSGEATLGRLEVRVQSEANPLRRCVGGVSWGREASGSS